MIIGILSYIALFAVLFLVKDEDIWTDQDCHYYAKKAGRNLDETDS